MKSAFMNWRTSVFGLLSWFVPFIASFPFFMRDGQLLVPLTLFKSIMVITGVATGSALLVFLFRRIHLPMGLALAVGLYWMLINLGLDILILVPMGDMALGDYFYDIGLRYVSIPLIALAMGAVAQKAK